MDKASALVVVEILFEAECSCGVSELTTATTDTYAAEFFENEGWTWDDEKEVWICPDCPERSEIDEE